MSNDHTEDQRKAERARRGVTALSRQLVKTGAEVERLRTQHWWTVFAYSEWLDAEQGLVVDSDNRTHEDLVNEFMAQHHSGTGPESRS